jgi:hypothetical protein
METKKRKARRFRNATLGPAKLAQLVLIGFVLTVAVLITVVAVEEWPKRARMNERRQRRGIEFATRLETTTAFSIGPYYTTKITKRDEELFQQVYQCIKDALQRMGRPGYVPRRSSMKLVGDDGKELLMVHFGLRDMQIGDLLYAVDFDPIAEAFSLKDLEIYYYPDGSRRAEGLHQNGLKHGEWTYFHRNGRIRASGKYDAGCKLGTWTYWDESGVQTTQTHLLDREERSGLHSP